MSYIINNSRGQIVAVVGDGTVNTTATDLSLVGRAVTNYGEYQNENYVYLLENFANGTAPVQPILGQLWYNANTDLISAYSTANTWTILASQNYVEAAKVSPAFSGVPTAPTAAAGTSNTQIATTAFVTNSPQFSGAPTAPTAPSATNSTWIATTAFVQNNKISPIFTGTPIAPTPSYNDDTQRIATTAFVQGEKTSPQFSGVPTAPTALAGDATTQIATTAFVTIGPQFTGAPTAPTAPLGTANTQIATTAFVTVGPQFSGAPTAPTPNLGTANTQLATTGFVVNALSYPGGLLGSMAQQNQEAVNITGGTVQGLSAPIPIASGGTGGNTQVSARAALGLQTGAVTVVCTMAAQNGSSVEIEGGNISGLFNPIPVASGGTGANSASFARNNLGLGTIATQSSSSVNLSGAITITGGQVVSLDAPVPVTAGGTGADNAQGARDNLGITTVFDSLGTMSTQNASSVVITGGSITGITPLLVNAGGTGGATAAEARSNLQAAWTSTTITAGTGLSGGGTLAASRTISIAANSNGYGTRYISTAAPTGGSNGDIWYQI